MQAMLLLHITPKDAVLGKKGCWQPPSCPILLQVPNTSECGFTEKGGKVISKAPALFPRKILLAFAILSAETPGLCSGDKARVRASLPLPSPPLGSPHRAVKHSPCVLQPLEGTRALERTARWALPSAGPTPAYTWEPQPRPG